MSKDLTSEVAVTHVDRLAKPTDMPLTVRGLRCAVETLRNRTFENKDLTRSGGGLNDLGVLMFYAFDAALMGMTEQERFANTGQRSLDEIIEDVPDTLEKLESVLSGAVKNIERGLKGFAYDSELTASGKVLTKSQALFIAENIKTDMLTAARTGRVGADIEVNPSSIEITPGTANRSLR